MNSAQYILEKLKIEGITHVFMVPGGYVDPFLTALSKVKKITPIVAAHEGGAAYMADGYARASGLFGAVLVVGGPGITNTVTGITTAFADQIPILLISGGVPKDWQGRGSFQDSSSAGVNDSSIFTSITKMQFEVACVNTLERDLDRLLRQMLSHSSRGPVHIALPVNIQSAEYNFSQPYKLPEVLYNPRFIDANVCGKVWEVLRKNKKIAILAGSGAVKSGATEELIKFAERFEIPVASTLAAKGVIPENHRLSLGIFGWYATRYAYEAIIPDEIEVLIVMGSKLNQFDTLAWSKAFRPKNALILNDINTNSVFREYYIDVPVLGDCQQFLKLLNAAPQTLVDELASSNKERIEWLKRIHATGTRLFQMENTTCNAVPMHPAQVISEFRKVMPCNTSVVVDTGVHALFAGHYWESFGPNQSFSSLNYIGAMGWAIGAGIGVKCARPNEPCAVITGDGCMTMQGMEIQTAARYGINVIFLVLNNSALGNPYLRDRTLGEYEGAITKSPTHDWVSYANALGVEGLKIEKPSDLHEKFKKALNISQTKPVVIDVICGRDFLPPAEPYEKNKKAGWAASKQ